MTKIVQIDPRDVAITPVFKHITIEDVAASEREGRPMMVTKEVVETRFAGTKNYSPIFPTDAQYRREGIRVITYAERWAEQYAAFKAGDDQQASGTPLEMLKPHGITDSQLSMCRALKIYSIEALNHLEGPALKSLGMMANDLKRMGSEWSAQRMSGSEAADMIAALQAQVAALQSANPLSVDEPTPTQVDEAIAAAEAEADDEERQKEELKDMIAELTGRRPSGRPRLDTLKEIYEEALAAK